MANVIMKNEAPPPRKPNGGITAAAAVFFGAALICAVAGAVTDNGLLYGIAFLSGFVFLALISAIVLPLLGFKTAGKRFGDAGERAAGAVLQQYLPPDYTVIQNKVVRSSKGTREIDNIVIGKTGVFIVEVKTMKGTLSGSYEMQDWVKDKTDNYGIEHRSIVENPVKQVEKQFSALKGFFEDNNVHAYINTILYFSYPGTQVNVSGIPERTPVFTYETTDSMIHYIMTRGTNNGKTLSDKTIKRIIQLLS